jgi:hypothetical protein
MKIGFLILILISSHFCLIAKEINRRNAVFVTRVTLLSDPATLKGVLSQVTDSSVIISGIGQFSQQTIYQNPIKEFHFSIIDEIRLQRKNSALRGFGYGALGGFLLAGIIHGMNKDDNSNSGDFASIGRSIEGGVYGSIGIVAGGVVGMVAGMSIKVKIPVKGNHENFSNNKEKLRNYSANR